MDVRPLDTLMKSIALLTFCFGFLFSVCAAPTWDQLNPGEDQVATFTLKAGKSKETEIDSSEPLFIGFKTDASKETVLKYFKQKPQPVLLRVVGVDSFVGSVGGAGAVFPPVNGKLRFIAENGTDVPLKIIIYKSKP